MSYTIINLNDEWVKDKTPDEIRFSITEEYIVIKKNDIPVPQKLHSIIQRPETGAVYCESPDQVLPIIQPHLQFRFEPEIIAVKTHLFNSENVKLDSLFDTLICVYNKAIVRRV